MKIIDWERKGNYARFYLGDDADTTYTGEDWDELHYEENAGPVDPDHVKGHADLILPVGWAVREPCNANWGYGWGTFSSEEAVRCIQRLLQPSPL